MKKIYKEKIVTKNQTKSTNPVPHANVFSRETEHQTSLDQFGNVEALIEDAGLFWTMYGDI